MSTTERRGYTKKTASDVSFYAGFVKGFLASVEGLLMFVMHKPLRKLVSQSLKPLRNATVAYVAFIIFIAFIVREPIDSAAQLLKVFMRWSRLVTVVVSLVLERALKANAEMFFAALKIRHPNYATALEQTDTPRRTTADRLRKLKRVGKIMFIRGIGIVVGFVFPESKMFITPALKFISVRSVLGNGLAMGLCTLEVLQGGLLADAHWDDVLTAIGEAIVDAEELSMDTTKEFYKRLPTNDDKKYFVKRFRGYLTGSGFCCSLLMQVPLVSIPVTLIAECSAACVVVEIVQQNLHKRNRRAFPCEELLKTEPQSGDSTKTD